MSKAEQARLKRERLNHPGVGPDPVGAGHPVGEATPTAESVNELIMDKAKKGIAPRKRARKPTARGGPPVA